MSESLVEIAFQGGPNHFGKTFRAVIQSIIPATLLSSPDLALREDPHPIRLISGPPPWRKPLWCLSHACIGDHYWCVAKVACVRLHYALHRLDGHIAAESMPHLEAAIRERERARDLKNAPLIYVGDRQAIEILCHETMHHIQHWLLSEHRDIYHRLRIEMLRQKKAVARLHKSLPFEFGYCVNDVFDSQPGAYVNEWYLRAPDKASAQVKEGFKKLNDEVAVQREHDEIACMLLGLHAQGNKEATSVLARVFAKAGLREDFEQAEAWAIQADGLMDRQARRRVGYAYSLLQKGDHSGQLIDKLKESGMATVLADRVAQDALLLWTKRSAQLAAAGLALMAPYTVSMLGPFVIGRTTQGGFRVLVSFTMFLMGVRLVGKAAMRFRRGFLLRAR
jgi:hypothetical protein